MRSKWSAMALASTMIGLGLGGCGGGSAADAAPAPAPASSTGAESLPTPDIDGARAHALVADGAFLLDVTPSPRNESSAIEGRVNIPLPELGDRLDEVPRDRPIVVYCFGGRGSPRAVQILRDAGYTDVHLLGAMANWEAPNTLD